MNQKEYQDQNSKTICTRSKTHNTMNFLGMITINLCDTDVRIYSLFGP